MWYSILVISHLFRLGSGAELSSVPTHEPNYLFDKATVQYGFLAKNNFDAGNDNDINNKLPKQYDLDFYDVYTVLQSLVFQGQAGHHDFSFYFYNNTDPHLRGRRVQAAKAPAGAPGATPMQYLSKLVNTYSKKDITAMQGILIGLSMIASIWILTLICHMFPGAQHHSAGQATKQSPPRWGPEMEGSYNFTEYMKDTQLWQMATDIAPHQQAAIIVLNLS